MSTNSTKMQREPIYGALLTFISGLSGIGVESWSRVFRPHTDYSSAAQLPAGCIDEDEESDRSPDLGLQVWDLKVDAWLYFAAPVVSQIPGQETIIPQTALNTALDGITNGFTPTIAQQNGPTLGGLVQWARIDGRIQKAVGVGSGDLQFCIAKVPILMRYAGPV